MKRILWVTCVLLIPTLALGQAQTTGRVTGKVVDEEGNPVAGARVTFISSALQGERVVTTSDSGTFLAAILPVGPYAVEFTSSGMQPVAVSFRLGVGETVPLNVTMKKGEEIVEEVTVYSTATAMETTAYGENFAYDKQVDELPIQNREIEGVAQYAPNITYGPTPENIAISGAPSYDTTVLLDGSEISDPYFGSSPVLYLEDAIEEVQVLTAGVSARYGRFQGGVVNAVTKTGGNSYDGTLRATFDNQSWNSQTPFGEPQADNLNEYYQLTVGGFILKDHLWWFGGITDIPDTQENQNTVISQPSLPITSTTTEERWQFKLRGAITPDHVIELNHLDFSQSTVNDIPLPPGNSLAAGDRDDPRTIDVVTYQGVLTPNLFLDVQYTDKSVEILGGGDPDGFDPVFDSTESAVFNNGWWDFSDASVRDNETLGINLTQSLSTANWGTHTVEYGAQYVESVTGGENRQSPTGFNLLAYSFDLANARLYGGTRPDGMDVFNVMNYFTDTCGQDGDGICQINYRWLALPLGGDQTIDNLAFYAHDAWEVGKWRFDAGLRWESYDGNGPLQSQKFDFDDVAPRLGVTFNIDQDWQVQAWYGKYVSRFNDGVFNEITGVSAAPRLEQLYAGANCFADPALNVGSTLSDGVTPIDPGGDGCDAADIGALLRDEGSWGLFTDVVDPQQPSVFNADDLDAPYANDYNFSVRRALPRNSGSIVFEYIYRDFNNLIDDFQGAVCDDFDYTYDGGQCSNTTDIFDPDDALLATVDTIIWGNTSIAQRTYNAFSVVANWTPSAKWGVGGNYTFGEIDGNYEGEGRNTPASGSLIGDHERGFSAELAYPLGTLDEEILQRARAWGSYRFDFDRAGALVVGSVFTFQTGQVYNHTASTLRNTNRTDGLDVDPDTGAIITTPIGPVCAPGQDPNLSPGCYTSQGGSFLGTYDGRGDFNFNDWWRLDLSARYQFPIWKELSGWVKIDALNVTNQDTLTSFQTTGEVVDDGTFTSWTPSPEFGTIQSEDNYQTPREWLLTVGIQF
jgi:hypothetical protein